MKIRTSLLLLAVSALAACGSNGTRENAISDLQARVARVRTDAVAGDLVAARAELASFSKTVASLLQTGVIDSARAQTMLAAAQDVAANLPLVQPSTPDTVQPSFPSDHRYKHKGKGHKDEKPNNGD